MVDQRVKSGCGAQRCVAPRTAIRSRWCGLHKGNAVFQDDDLQASNSETVRRVVISGIEQLALRVCELSFMR